MEKTIGNFIFYVKAIYGFNSVYYGMKCCIFVETDDLPLLESYQYKSRLSLYHPPSSLIPFPNPLISMAAMPGVCMVLCRLCILNLPCQRLCQIQLSDQNCHFPYASSFFSVSIMRISDSFVSAVTVTSFCLAGSMINAIDSVC
jgi:hypothetical protein